MKKIILLCIVINYFLQVCYSQAGHLDPSFGNNGIVTADFGNNISFKSAGKQVLLQPDGSLYIILEVDGRTLIAKRFSNGSADSSYGLNGVALAAGISNGHAVLQQDGKLLIAGSILTNLGKDSEGDNDIIVSDFGVASFNNNGSPDNTFGIDGKTITDFKGIYSNTSDYDIPTAVAIQSDGKIVVVGYTKDDIGNTDFALARYNSNGSLDATFDDDGVKILDITYDDQISSLAIQSDGKIVVTAVTDGNENTDENGNFSPDFLIARFDIDGSLDSTFSGDGRQYVDFGLPDVASSVAIQNDGKIVVAGSVGTSDQNSLYQNFGLARCNSDGTLDSSFSGDGKQTTDFGFNNHVGYNVVIQSDGKIIVTGYSWNGTDYDFALARYTTDGNQDNSFSGDGKQVNNFGSGDDYAYSTAIQNDGKIIICGTAATSNDGANFALVRYKSDGTLDNTFDSDGILQDHYVTGNTIYKSTAIQTDGKIVAVGSAWNGANFDFALARYNTNGTLDKTFDGDGKKTTDLGYIENAISVALQNDGKIVILGTSQKSTGVTNFLVRYNSNGSRDNTFNGNSRQAVPNPISIVKVQKDGKILVGGTESLTRYNSNGTLDLTFNGTGRVLTYATDFVLQNNGKIVVITPGFGAVRYNIDGSVDHSFVSETPNFFPGFDPDGYDSPHSGATSIAIQSDGKIIVGGFAGFYRRYSEDDNIALVRFNTNGSLDHTFSDDGIMIINFKTFSTNASVATGSDNKIVVKGWLYNSISQDQHPDKVLPAGFGFAQIYNNGTLNGNFGTGGIQYPEKNEEIENIVIGNNKLYAAGSLNDVGRTGFLASYLLDNTPQKPIISIAKPSHDTTYIAVAKIKINAAASDADGKITKVQFYNGATLLHTETVAPYDCIIDSAAVGHYAISARATDNDGNVTTSAVVNITVVPNKAPTVKITSPVSGATFTAPANIILNADANDVDGRIIKVDFYNGSTLLFTETATPYSRNWFQVPIGNYSITAKATDNNGAVTTSAVVNIHVVPDLPPTVNITSPLNGASFTAPANIVLSADAKDVNGKITKVDFYDGTTLLFTETAAPYSRKWFQVPVGNYSITAKATDNTGKTTTSAPVAIFVGAVPAPMARGGGSIILAGPLSLNVNPNPVAKTLNVSIEGLQTNTRSAISVLSISGVVIKTIQSNTLNKKVELDVSSLSAGVYFIKVMNGDKVLYNQFMKL